MQYGVNFYIAIDAITSRCGKLSLKNHFHINMIQRKSFDVWYMVPIFSIVPKICPKILACQILQCLILHKNNKFHKVLFTVKVPK